MLSKVKILTIIALLTMVSCKIDDRYNIKDMNDIDTDVTLFSENGLDFPLGDLKEMTIEELFSKLDDKTKELITIKNDEYIISKSDIISLNDEIDKLNLKSFNNLDGILISDNINVELINTPVQIVASGKIEFSDNSEKDFTVLKTKDFPEHVSYVKELLFDNVFASITADFNGLPDIGADFDAEIKLEMPEFVSPSLMQFSGVIHNGKLMTKELEKPNPIQINGLKNIDLTQDKDIEGKVIIHLYVSSPELDRSLINIPEAIKCNLVVNIGNNEGKLGVAKAIGYAEKELESRFSLKLDNLPEELKNENTVIDIRGAGLQIDFNSNLGFPFGWEMTINPWKNGKCLENNAIKKENVKLPYSLSANECKSSSISINEDEINKLVRQFPDSLVIEFEGAIVKNMDCIVEPSASYTLDIEYTFDMPLDFGPDLNLILNSDFELGEISQYLIGNEVGITGTMVNDTPFSLTADLEVLDKEGNSLQMNNGVESLSIKGNESTEICYSVSLPENIDKNDISKGRINIKIGSAGGKIRPSQKISLTDLKAHLPKGITIKTSK